jgi:glycosyltransferase involved in cell wall biosynthesis
MQRQIRLDDSTKISQPPPPAATIETPVSIVLIVKNAAGSLARTLRSLRTNFTRECDEILVLDTGSTDGGETFRTAKKFRARVESRPGLRQDLRPYVEKWLPESLENFKKTDLASGCILDFAAARQIASDLAKHDIQFWIDADDEFAEDEPGRLRAMVDKVFGDGTRDSIFLDYVYATDKGDGSVSSVLKRERIYDRRVYHWKGRCHETAIPRPGVTPKGGAYFSDLHSGIKHHRDHADSLRSSDIRNYVIIRKEIEETATAKDPRSIFYLGNAARGLTRDGEALDLYKEFIDLSGSRDDRFAAAYYCAITYASEKHRRPLDAIDWFMRCVRLKPEDPRGYFGLSRCYFQLQRWQETLHWFKVGTQLPEPVACLANYNPLQISLYPYEIAAMAAKELGMRGEAIQFVEELRRRHPDHPDTKQVQEEVGNWIAGKDLVESVRRLVANSHPKTAEEATKIGREIVSRLPDVPSELEEMGLARLEPADGREGRDLAIWCGKAIEAWGPRSGDAGIGGSEKAVIQMAPRLQRRGFRVTVYTNVPPEQRGLDSKTGVVWQHFGAFDRERPRDTVIFWRAPEALELPFSTRRRILWCHDVQNPARWTPARVALADQVWVLSKFHATTLGPVAAQLGPKFIVTRNGIDGDLFQKHLGGPRDVKKVIYASSPDRGLLSAIRIFRAADVPGSTLHVFYGFNKVFLKMAADREYGRIPDINRDANMYEYMQAVLQAADADERIVWHGRVGWEPLVKEMCGAGAWLYPCRFDEISCMAGMEAQAAGLICLNTDHAALAETVQNAGFIVHADQVESAAGLLKKTLNDFHGYDREALSRRAIERFSYENLADDWVKLLQ